MRRAGWSTLISVAFPFCVCLLGALHFVYGHAVATADAVLTDVREVTDSQRAYADLNGGFNEGELSCLVRPGTCIPSQREQWRGKSVVSAGQWTDSLLMRWTQPGRTFSRGPAPDAKEVSRLGLSESSVRGFRYIAEVESHWWSPRAGYCGDATGHLCELSAIPRDENPYCPADCRRIE